MGRVRLDELHERGLDMWRGPGVLREEKHGKTRQGDRKNESRMKQFGLLRAKSVYQG